jgi:hypothetical protein
MQERARTAQTEASEAQRDRTKSLAEREKRDAANRARTEGLDGLLDDLEAGLDVNSAVTRYNARGTHRLDPTKLQFDKGSRRIVIDDPEEGRIDTTVDVLRAGIDADMERGTKGVVTAEGLVNERTGRLMRKNPPKEKERKTRVLAPGQILADEETGKIIARGDPKQGGGGKGGAGGAGGKGGKGGNGRKLSTFNPETWQGAGRAVLGTRLGAKLDDKGVVYPKEGTSKQYTDYAAKVNQIGRKTGYALSPDEVVNVVADVYDELKPFEDYLKDAERALPYEASEMRGNAASRLSAEQNTAARRSAAKRAYDRDRAAADAEIDRIITQASQLAQEEAAAMGGDDAAEDEVDPADAGGEEIPLEDNPNDDVPAAEPGAAAAPSAAAAPRRYVFTDPKTKKATQLDVSDGLTKRLKGLPAGSRLPDPRVPGLFWVLGPDGSPRPQ